MVSSNSAFSIESNTMSDHNLENLVDSINYGDYFRMHSEWRNDGKHYHFQHFIILLGLSLTEYSPTFIIA